MSLFGWWGSAPHEEEEREESKERSEEPTSSKVKILPSAESADSPLLLTDDREPTDAVESSDSVEVTADGLPETNENLEPTTTEEEEEHEDKYSPTKQKQVVEVSSNDVSEPEEGVNEDSESMQLLLEVPVVKAPIAEPTKDEHLIAPSKEEESDNKRATIVLQKTTEETVPEDEHETDQLDDEEEVEEDPEDEIDLDFVEQYDNAFNEFVVQHTQFILSNPDLVHNLRVIKLQALLTHQDDAVHNLESELEAVQQSKAEMELLYQEQLRDASRKKAARDISLRSQLKELKQETRDMEASMTWKLIEDSQQCAKNQQLLLEQFKNEQAPPAEDRNALLSLLPEGPFFDAVRDAANEPAEPLTTEQEEAIRQCQIDNAFLNGEIALLKKKLEYQKAAAVKQGWVESVLVRMDKKSMKKLKSRYKKKSGVQL